MSRFAAALRRLPSSAALTKMEMERSSLMAMATLCRPIIGSELSINQAMIGYSYANRIRKLTHMASAHKLQVHPHTSMTGLNMAFNVLPSTTRCIAIGNLRQRQHAVTRLTATFDARRLSAGQLRKEVIL